MYTLTHISIVFKTLTINMTVKIIFYHNQKIQKKKKKTIEDFNYYAFL